MNNLIRGTTPNVSFKNTSDLDLSTLKEIWFTFAQKSTGVSITYSLSKNEVAVDPEANTISVSMSQKDTLAFNPDTVEIQIRCLDSNEQAYASDVFTEKLARVIKGGVIGE